MAATFDEFAVTLFIDITKPKNTPLMTYITNLRTLNDMPYLTSFSKTITTR
jgi:hypothetical protein